MAWQFENRENRGFFARDRSVSSDEEVAGTITIRVVDLFCT